MPNAADIQSIRNFKSLIKYLRKRLDGLVIFHKCSKPTRMRTVSGETCNHQW